MKRILTTNFISLLSFSVMASEAYVTLPVLEECQASVEQKISKNEDNEDLKARLVKFDLRYPTNSTISAYLEISSSNKTKKELFDKGRYFIDACYSNGALIFTENDSKMLYDTLTRHKNDDFTGIYLVPDKDGIYMFYK